MWFPSRTKVLGAITLLSILGGCSEIYYDRRESISLGAGDALAANKAVHTVDPWPANVGNQNIAFNGQRMQTAVERYRQNRVTPPVSISTSSAGYLRTQPDAATTTAPSTSAPAAAPVR
jgi:hypothetical protein